MSEIPEMNCPECSAPMEYFGGPSDSNIFTMRCMRDGCRYQQTCYGGRERNEAGEQEALRFLRNVGALITDSHFVYTSGRHGSVYINKDAIYPNPLTVADLCGQIVMHFDNEGNGVNYEVVVGPEKGGIILAQWTAYNSVHRWVPRKDILAVYAEKEGDGFVFRRGYNKLIPDKRVLIVEDVITTGGSVKKVVEAVRALDGDVLGVGAICNRGGVTAKDLDVPELYALLNLDLESWAEEACPLCLQGIPINTGVGKGREFLARRQA